MSKGLIVLVFRGLVLLLFAVLPNPSEAWVPTSSSYDSQTTTTTNVAKPASLPFSSSVEPSTKTTNTDAGDALLLGRRQVLWQTAATAFVAVATTTTTPDVANAAVTRAIGGAEEACRAAGNCLETGEWDGAIGWSWGGKDRCDATDPLCGPDGKLLDELPTGDAVPPVSHKITHVVALSWDIGREETVTLKLGLYGADNPASVKQFLQFVSQKGLATTSALAFENGMGVDSVPVSLQRGGILGQIVPSQRLDFGIPSQAAAYARSRGRSKAGDSFLAQPRPEPLLDEPSLRPHDMAGLLSIPSKGIGYGGSGLIIPDDECFESAFEITATSLPSIDKNENRRVIGQILDQKSMADLARLATLPVKKGFKGVIPGQNSGPPLLRVTLSDVVIAAVTNPQEP